MIKDKSQEVVGFGSKGGPLKQKTMRRAELAAKLDKHHNMNSAQNKLPPSIRWVTADEDPDPDFFSNLDTRYERNPKAIAQLAPLMSNTKKDQHKMDWKHGVSTEPIDYRISMTELSLKKKGQLRPLRD